MKKHILPFAAGLLCAMQPVAASADDVDLREFNPTGDWTIDFGDDYCRLSRTFSDGEHALALAIERSQPGFASHFILVGDGFRPFRGADHVGLRLLPSDVAGDTFLLESRTEGGESFFDLGFVSFVPGGLALQRSVTGADSEAPIAPPYDMATERGHARQIDRIVLDEGLYRPVSLATGNLEAPVEALQICAQDLLDHWGVDGARHATATRAAEPEGELEDWLPRIRVRRDQLAALAGNRNGVRVMIDEAGSPTSCRVQSMALGEAINRTLCDALMENGQFQPALDASGQPMASYWMIDSPLLLAVANRQIGAPLARAARNSFGGGFIAGRGQNMQGNNRPHPAPLQNGN